MRQILLATALILAAFATAPANPNESSDIDELIALHIAAIGGFEKIKAIDNLVFSEGLYQEGEYTGEGNATMSMARPYFKLVGDKNNPGDYLEGYDGMAWEWFKNPGVVIRTVGEPSEAIRHYAGVESPLVDYKKKGSTAEIIGETTLDDKAVTVIEITRRDGFIEQFYIDMKTHLIMASGYEAPIHAFGEDVVRLSRITDFRRVAGVLMAHRFESVEIPSGKMLSSMQWRRIEANKNLPDDWFSPPRFERDAVQAFIEQLYEQRMDIDSMMWTYHEFRLAHPKLDTSNAVNIAGFQNLKMGATEAAIALLEQNVSDFPDVVDARFGLGRAYRGAGRLDEARVQFKAALAIDPDNARSKAALEKLDTK